MFYIIYYILPILSVITYTVNNSFVMIFCSLRSASSYLSSLNFFLTSGRPVSRFSPSGLPLPLLLLLSGRPDPHFPPSGLPPPQLLLLSGRPDPCFPPSGLPMPTFPLLFGRPAHLTKAICSLKMI